MYAQYSKEFLQDCIYFKVVWMKYPLFGLVENLEAIYSLKSLNLFCFGTRFYSLMCLRGPLQLSKCNTQVMNNCMGPKLTMISVQAKTLIIYKDKRVLG